MVIYFIFAAIDTCSLLRVLSYILTPVTQRLLASRLDPAEVAVRSRFRHCLGAGMWG